MYKLNVVVRSLFCTFLYIFVEHFYGLLSRTPDLGEWTTTSRVTTKINYYEKKKKATFLFISGDEYGLYMVLSPQFLYEKFFRTAGNTGEQTQTDNWTSYASFHTNITNSVNTVVFNNVCKTQDKIKIIVIPHTKTVAYKSPTSTPRTKAKC